MASLTEVERLLQEMLAIKTSYLDGRATPTEDIDSYDPHLNDYNDKLYEVVELLEPILKLAVQNKMLLVVVDLQNVLADHRAKGCVDVESVTSTQLMVEHLGTEDGFQFFCSEMAYSPFELRREKGLENDD